MEKHDALDFTESLAEVYKESVRFLFIDVVAESLNPFVPFSLSYNKSFIFITYIMTLMQ